MIAEKETARSAVLRGGSWSGSPQFVRAADRDRDEVAVQYYSGGFRLARTLP